MTPIRLVKYPKTRRFQALVEELNSLPEPLPPLDFVGSVKLHGTQAAITLQLETGELSLQSRQQNLGSESEHSGFVAFVKQHEPQLLALMQTLSQRVSGSFASGNLLTLYGEWAGDDIKRGVALAQLPKCWYTFALKHAPAMTQPQGNREEAVWLDPCLPSEALFPGLEQISDYSQYHLRVDFHDPASVTRAESQIAPLIASIENSCPLAKAKGVIGIGEGIVWVHQSTQHGRIAFKSKGTLYEQAEKRPPEMVSPEKQAQIQGFIDSVLSETRLQSVQASEKVSEKKHTGRFLKAINTQIFAQEQERLQQTNLTWSDVEKRLSKSASNWLRKRLKSRASHS